MCDGIACLIFCTQQNVFIVFLHSYYLRVFICYYINIHQIEKYAVPKDGTQHLLKEGCDLGIFACDS